MRLDDTAALRRVILRIMLGALAVSAALTVLGVLVGRNSEQASRMVGTGISAAITSGLLLASCKFLDSDKYRRTGLFVMVLILAEFILVLIAIWSQLWISRFGSGEENILETAAIFPVVWIPAALFFHIRQLRGGRLSGLLGMAACALALVFFLMGTWSPWSWSGPRSMAWAYWGIGWACWFFGFGAAATTGGVGVDQRHWRWIGLAAAILSLGLGVHFIWTNQEMGTPLFAISTTLAILIGHLNLIWLCQLKPRQRPLRWITAIFAAIACATFDYATLGDVNEDLIWRIGTATGICAGCGTVAIAILAAFNRRLAPRPTGDIDAGKIDLVCPICHKKQTVPI
jgi:hypothetical protein